MTLLPRLVRAGWARSIAQPTPNSGATCRSSASPRPVPAVPRCSHAYMSLDQVAGGVVAYRTDIFSLGIVLYEMSSGHRPFLGNSSAALASAILCDAPRPLLELRANLPEALGSAVHRCLAKNVAE